MRERAAAAAVLVLLVAFTAVAADAQPSPSRTVRVIVGGGTPTRAPTPIVTAVPEPPPAFGRVVYRASKAASFETLGVVVIACRHRDPERHRFALEFFDRAGKKVSLFGPSVVPNVPAGKKIVFVTEGTHFRNRDVIDVRAGHFTDGTARVLSDARIVHCMGRMRFDPGARAKTYWRSVGLYRDGVGATPVPVDW